MDKQAQLKHAGQKAKRDISSLTIPERALIMSESFERPISPSQLCHEWGLPIKYIARHFQRMAEDGFLEIVAESVAPSGGGRHQPLYRATQRILFHTEEWEKFSREDREGHTFVVFITYLARISLAISSGSMDRDFDRHFTWAGVNLDQPAWIELQARLDGFLDWVLETLQVEAALRMQESEEKPVSVTVGLGGFRHPSKDELIEALKRTGDGDADPEA
jgi:AraC-like DNA-binding protein